MLELKDIYFEYTKGNPVVNHLHLQIQPGEIVWLHGANGSGKSTLLRIIAHLVEAKGEIAFENKRVEQREDLLPHLAYFPDDPYLFEYLTGEENARYLQSLFAIPDKQFEQLFYPLASCFGLTPSLHHYVQEYSLGMRHKLYWAALFARNAKVYLLDEPFAPFDQETQKFAKKLLKEKAQAGALILFVSHLQEIGKELATVTYSLEEGQLKRGERCESHVS